jgi:HEAT repeat protein
MYDERLKLLGIMLITGVIAFLVTFIGHLAHLSWIVQVLANTPLIIMGAVIVVAVRGFASRPYRALGFMGIAVGLCFVGFSFQDSPYTSIQYLGGQLAPIAAIIGVLSIILAAIASGYPTTVEQWRDRGDEGIRQLIQRLKSRDSFRRAQAAWILGDLGALEAVEPLIQVLADPESGVRAEAARALGALGDVRAIAALQDMQRHAALSPENRPLQEIATEAIQRLQKQQRS